MRSMTNILMAAVLTLGLTGAALADDRGDEGWRGSRPGDGGWQGESWRDRQDGRNSYDWSDGRGSDGRAYGRGVPGRRVIVRGPVRRVYSGRVFVGRRVATPILRIRILEARRHLRRVEWFALRDGIVTRWERVRIHQARERLAWLMQRTYGGSC